MHELTITGPCPARRMILDEGMHLIGRMPTCEIHLEGEGISREHARIEVQGPEAVVLDQGSTNGTQVAGQPIDRHRLEDGDVIGVGRYRLLYRRAVDPADLTEVDVPGAPVQVPAQPPAPNRGGEVRLQRQGADRGEEPAERAHSAAGPSNLPERERSWPPQPVAAASAPSESRRSARRPRRELRLGLAAPEPSQPDPAPVPGRRLRINFRARLAVALLGLVLLSVVLIGFGLITRAEELMATEAQSRARTLTYLLAEMNAEKLRGGDLRLITELMTSELGVRRALLLDEVGRVLAPAALRGQTDAALQAAAGSNEYLRQITPDGALLSVPIRSGGRRYGTAVLDFSVGYLKQESAQMGLLAILLGLFVGAVALLGAGVLERLAQRPFAALASEVDVVLKGDLRGEVPLTTDGRANQLCEALNRLIRRAGEKLASRVEASGAASGRTDSAVGALSELAELLPVGVLGVGEDGQLLLCNDATADLLGCDVQAGRTPHLLDAFSRSPQLGGLMALLKESRQAPDKTWVQRLDGTGGLEARARTLPADGRRLTLIVLEPVP
jgi:PAS domain-containing protein